MSPSFHTLLLYYLLSCANIKYHFAASFLQTRHWTGLEQKRGQTEVTNAVEGRAGIAAGYTHEMDENKLKRNHSSQE